jgi:hypothetical protein
MIAATAETRRKSSFTAASDPDGRRAGDDAQVGAGGAGDSKHVAVEVDVTDDIAALPMAISQVRS